MLAYAHDPEAIGMGYIRMAQLQWERDRPRVARACLQRAREYVPGPLWAAGMQVMAIMGHALDPEGEPTRRGGAGDAAGGGRSPGRPRTA